MSETIHQRITKSGLTLQAVPLPGTNVVTTLILVGAGSRYETWDISGISHFLEHMFFKGAEKYKTPKEVSRAVDRFGGAFNAFTGKEYAGYYVKCGKAHTESAIDVLSDMLLKSRFETAEIEKERGVILEEMAMYLDAPMYQISWDFERLVFGDQPLGWDQIGTKELIRGVTQEQFKQYQKELYVPENMVVTVAGAVDEGTLDLLEKYFEMEDAPMGRALATYDETVPTQRIKMREKKTEQYHISLGVKAIAECDPRYAALKVLTTILGGNMSSRMFQNVREQKGLCYSIRTLVEEYTDTGLMTTRAGVKLSDVLLAAEGICDEYRDIRENGVTDEELTDAKNYLIGKTDLNTEDTEDVAHHYAKNTLLYGLTEHYSEWKAKLGAVTKEDVETLAKELLKPENLRFAGIGPAVDEAALLAILNR